MTSIFEEFPDFEALAAAIIRNSLDARVYSSLPQSPTFPLILVQRIGGVPIEEHHLDLASIQVDVWGTNKSEARLLATQARVALHESEGVYHHSDDSGEDWPVTAYVTRVRDTTGLAWAPDPISNRDRYVFGVTIAGHS